MFSALFGKRRSSPVEDETPPIPGPKSDDGFVIVDPNSPRGSLYPSISGIPYPQRPAPAPPTGTEVNIDQGFHYLHGVPFSLSRELQLSTNKDTFATEIGDLLVFLTNRLKMNNFDYDFSTEKSVLKDC